METACQLCGAHDFEVVSERDRHGGALRTVLCLGCGSITNDPIPSDAELEAFYRSDYRTEYKGTAEPRARQIWRNFDRIERHVRTNRPFYEGRRRCLDLGSGSGEFMYMAGRMGMDCIGVEPNEPYAAYTRARLGLNVLTQTLEATVFPAGEFDLIRLSHVMEHMRRPVRSLEVLRNWLADDGLLYIEVPNIELEATRKMRGKMFHYGHIFNFSPWTFRAAAGLAGFEEHPDSKARYADQTLGFFRKGAAIAQGAAANPANALAISAAMKAHNERLLPQPENQSAFGRGLSSISARLSEIIAARRFNSPREIADHFADRLVEKAAR